MAKRMRREFLKASGATALAVRAGGMAAILASGQAPAFAQTHQVHWLRWNDFVPACDQLLRQKLLPEAEKALGIKVSYETVNGNDLQPRITSGIQSGAGPDLIMLFNNHPHLYKASLVDLTRRRGGDRQGAGRLYRSVERQLLVSGGKYFSMPMAIIGAMNAYRKSMFDEVGYNAFPKTWDEYRDAGKKLKAKGYPDRPVARPVVRRSADVRLSVACGRSAATEVDDKGKVVDQLEGDGRGRQVHGRACGRTRWTRAVSPGTTRPTTARSCPARSARR